jgi:hypothetical protein
MTRRIEFRLYMPGRASWDGRWSGEGKDYLIYHTLRAAAIAALSLPNSWGHAFDDGWYARVSARLMEPGERRKKSAGFSGYDWMVRNILRWGHIACRCEWRELSAEISHRYGEGQWEECSHCHRARRSAA